MSNFYRDIPSFDDFLELTDERHYFRAPDDWVVVITDVEGSTKAIKEGRYKIVNMVGASCIASMINAIGDREIPFVFGGDGATAVIPSSSLVRVRQALIHSQLISKEEHGLNLRIGIVPHSDLLAANSSVNIAKFRLAKDNYLAFFKGSGLSLAEKWVKQGKYNLEAGGLKIDFDPHEGLSCRWSPIKNQRGLILSILIKVNESQAPTKLLKDIIDEIDHIVDLDHHDTHPIKPDVMKTESIKKSLAMERKMLKGAAFWRYLMSILEVIGVTLMNLPGPKWFVYKGYKKAMRTNSDFRKYDETLRMVIDCSLEMKAKIEQILQRHADRNEIYFGTFASETALMTCFVENMRDDGHVHFVDGGDGGYAMAAVAMKQQMKG